MSTVERCDDIIRLINEMPAGRIKGRPPHGHKHASPGVITR